MPLQKFRYKTFHLSLSREGLGKFGPYIRITWQLRYSKFVHRELLFGGR